MNPVALARPEVRALRGYRPESGQGRIWLHANESAWPAAGQEHLRRYPEGQPAALRGALADYYGVAAERILMTRGSDDAIDLLVRSFCRPGRDAVAVTPPTFAMYGVAAQIQGAPLREIPLRGPDFELDAAALCQLNDVRLIFFGSPNNPTGGRIAPDLIAAVCRALAERALVVVDEAYVEFSSGRSITERLPVLPNLVVLRTLSKAHALAGARFGILLAAPEVVQLLRGVLPPYPLPEPTVAAALQALTPIALRETEQRIARTVAARDTLYSALQAEPAVARVWAGDANFLLVRWQQPAAAHEALAAAGIVLRWFSEPALAGCARISIGTDEENQMLLKALETLR